MLAQRLFFPRSARLLQASEFRAVFRHGRRARSGALHARLRPNGRPRGRLGLAIGRKAIRRAAGRNRVRRQVRESFRLNQRQLAGLDIVVSLNPRRDRKAGDLWQQLPEFWNEVARAARKGGEWKG